MLREVLRGRNAEIFIAPRTKDELAVAVGACARARVPITVRGAGSGQFGQGVPLSGGAVIDVAAITGIVDWADKSRALPTSVRARTGTIVSDIDAHLRRSGWELRMHPSSAQHATIGGYIAGGHAGVGSCQWGILRDTGNITAIEVMTVEEQPRLVELRGAAVTAVQHAFGANGIITEVELPVAPAWEWHELVVSFPTFEQALRFSVDLGNSDGLLTKVISPQAHPLPRYLPELADLVPDGDSMVLALVAVQSVPNVVDLIAATGGTLRYRCREGKGCYGSPLYEFTWGHSLSRYQRHNPELVGLMGLFPPDRLYQSLAAVHRDCADLGPLKVELKRVGGRLSAQGSPIIDFVSKAHLERATERLEALGVSVANPHTPLLGAGGMKPWGANEAALKREMDPFALLAQGKVEPESSLALATGLPNRGWTY
ncbi:FAD-linked oxidase [Nocardia camponoti]|uniref:FAD-linked oxidase n=2 Tax=Nocardia camponoti TaxID=1616106 RepID=A0A917QF75_9NOCA|nr:FAD-linked oxidase [Nocardia camponoti]